MVGIGAGTQEENNTPPLISAVLEKNLPKVLSIAGSNKAAVDEAWGIYQETPLELAVDRGYTLIARTLMGAGAQIDRPKASGVSHLFAAVREVHTETTQALLAAFADPSQAVTIHGLTPLFVAIKRRRPREISLLLEAGADPHQTIYGEPPAQIARNEGYTEGATLIEEEIRRQSQRWSPIRVAFCVGVFRGIQVRHQTLSVIRPLI